MRVFFFWNFDFKVETELGRSEIEESEENPGHLKHYNAVFSVVLLTVGVICV